jgi:hypothetical protein
MNSAPHTHTVAPVWRAERGQPLGGGCARPASLGVLRSAAHRRAEFRLPVWLRGVYISSSPYTTRLRLCVGFGGPAWWYCVKLSVVRCDSVRHRLLCLLTYLLMYVSISPAGNCNVQTGWHGGTIVRSGYEDLRHTHACTTPTRARLPPRGWYERTRRASLFKRGRTLTTPTLARLPPRRRALPPTWVAKVRGT